MRARFAWTLAALAAALVGCQTGGPGGRTASDKVPHLDAGVAAAAGLRPQEVSDANALYVAKCARCHKFYNPADYDNAEWHSWMTRMSRKARLKPDQQELLSRYLQAYRTAQKDNVNKPVQTP